MNDSRVSETEYPHIAKSEEMQSMVQRTVDSALRGNVVLIRDVRFNPERISFAKAVADRMGMKGQEMLHLEPGNTPGLLDSYKYAEGLRGIVLLNADTPTQELQLAVAEGRTLPHIRLFLGFTRMAPAKVRGRLLPEFSQRCTYFPEWPKLWDRPEDHSELRETFARDFPNDRLHPSARSTLMKLDSLDQCYRVMYRIRDEAKAKYANFVGTTLDGRDISAMTAKMGLSLTVKPVEPKATAPTSVRLSA